MKLSREENMHMEREHPHASGEKCPIGYDVDKVCPHCAIPVANMKKHTVGFERRVSYAGRSLIITVPEDLAKHMHIKRGSGVKVIPVDEKTFMVEVLD